jgi:hypothetical protein
MPTSALPARGLFVPSIAFRFACGIAHLGVFAGHPLAGIYWLFDASTYLA